MDQHLYKYLVLHKQLCIPQLGSFVIKSSNARYENGSEFLQAPKPILYFTDETSATSEKFFFDFLANEMNVDEVTAIKLFHDFSYRFRNDLVEKGSVELKGVGTLTKKEDNKIVFQPTHNLSDLLPPVKQSETLPVTHIENEPVATEEVFAEENKDNWWMYAIILSILGIGALLYYYI